MSFSFSPTRRARTALAGAATAALVLASGAAYADDIHNNLDLTIDATAELMPLDANGSAGTTTLAVDPTNGDGKNGCNLTGQTTLTVSVTSSDTDVATVNPSSVTFTSCGAVPTLTVTPHEAGTADITLAQTSNGTGATFDFAPARFTVVVTTPTPTNTAPSIDVAGVEPGAEYPKGSVPAATCEVTDQEDGDSSFPAELSEVTGLNSADGLGAQTATCSYEDEGGLVATSSETYSIVDTSAPSISYTLSPADPDGANNWYKSDVTLTWNVADADSPNSLAETGCVDQQITADQDATTYSCSATSAGGMAGPLTVTVRRDASLPLIDGSLSAEPNTKGWFNNDVTVTFTCSDATSGVATCSPSTTLGEGANQSVTGNATDNAGNSASRTVPGINIDKTAPTIGRALSPSAPNANGWFNADVTVSFLCADELSGVDTCVADGEPGNVKSLSEGADQSVTGTATDKAGNTATDSASGINIDNTAPSVNLVGGPASSTYYFGFVPESPTCTASDALSGLDGTCSVTGYGSGVGTHTVTATATDKAGNQSTASVTYTVSAWRTNGFFQPVDMGGVVNTVKAGSTVPLKFELFAGPTELVDPTYIQGFTVTKVAALPGSEDAVETLSTTGGTSLRYDTTAGQFIQNWKTPTTKGDYHVTMTALDGSTITASFRLK